MIAYWGILTFVMKITSMQLNSLRIIIHAVLALMFLLFAIVQFNDPDPLIWILVYGAMVVVTVMAAFRYFNRWLLRALLLLFIAYSTLFVSGFWYWLTHQDKGALFDDLAKMQYPYVEETREFLGLIICIIVLASYLVIAPKQRSKLTS